ncbi:5-oxoprolinase subunit C family protein [Alkalihalobacterium elongatum]|uniref:5-oxoprolinase subunit C family protein n=1 Tax=Alkalihalobacterium elongatum TaxID=2675466 RepID=UPI001C1F9B71|nr:biotin-dependent carboxyltransferase family protein [Alkalihalobacterium elongatum]
MKTAQFKVTKPGLFTTIQDLGRRGYQRYGVVVSGVMDSYAFQLGNLLVHNDRNAAAIEITIVGPRLEILDDTIIAITGADLEPAINDQVIPMWQQIRVRKGQVLSFGRCISGARAYVAVRGGIDVPSVLKSKSTYVRGNMGGIKGRALHKGDILFRWRKVEDKNSNWVSSLHPSLIPKYEEKNIIRVIRGPEWDSFLPEDQERFFKSVYTVGHQSDRMGYRLTGYSLTHKQGADILSDVITFGTVQVPKSGEPIIMMADRQTTGGYTRIAQVIAVDLRKLAQMKPGDRILFKEESIKAAHLSYIQRERILFILSQLF